jgi:hypothetical protein
MKRSGWIACLVIGGFGGLIASAWSRASVETEQSGPASVASEAAACNSTDGQACSCGTGTNRAALLKQSSQNK